MSATGFASAVEERFVQSNHKRCEAAESQAIANPEAPDPKVLAWTSHERHLACGMHTDTSTPIRRPGFPVVL